MRVLIIGAGVIGSNLAADLFSSGRDVTLLARGEWADTLEKNGLVIDPIFSPGKKKYRIPVIRDEAGILGVYSLGAHLDRTADAFPAVTIHIEKTEKGE